MEEEAFNDAYALFVEEGYKGSIHDFRKLISTNNEALAVAHTLFVDAGYNGDLDKFSTLLGVKKKDASDVTSQGTGLDSEAEYYQFKGKHYTYSQLKKKYGKNTDKAIKEFGFTPVVSIEKPESTFVWKPLYTTGAIYGGSVLLLVVLLFVIFKKHERTHRWFLKIICALPIATFVGWVLRKPNREALFKLRDESAEWRKDLLLEEMRQEDLFFDQWFVFNYTYAIVVFIAVVLIWALTEKMLINSKK